METVMKFYGRHGDRRPGGTDLPVGMRKSAKFGGLRNGETQIGWRARSTADEVEKEVYQALNEVKAKKDAAEKARETFKAVEIEHTAALLAHKAVLDVNEGDLEAKDVVVAYLQVEQKTARLTASVESVTKAELAIDEAEEALAVQQGRHKFVRDVAMKAENNFRADHGWPPHPWGYASTSVKRPERARKQKRRG